MKTTVFQKVMLKYGRSSNITDIQVKNPKGVGKKLGKQHFQFEDVLVAIHLTATCRIHITQNTTFIRSKSYIVYEF